MVITVWEYDSPDTISPIDSNNKVSGVVAASADPRTNSVKRARKMGLGGKPRVPGARAPEFSDEELFSPFEFVDHIWFNGPRLDPILDFVGIGEPATGQYPEFGWLVVTGRFGKPYG